MGMSGDITGQQGGRCIQGLQVRQLAQKHREEEVEPVPAVTPAGSPGKKHKCKGNPCNGDVIPSTSGNEFCTTKHCTVQPGQQRTLQWIKFILE